MKFISKLLLAAGAILLFLMFFYTGVSLTQTTPKLAKFVTGISNWEYEVQGQTAVFIMTERILAIWVISVSIAKSSPNS
jgi:hypothetical protein